MALSYFILFYPQLNDQADLAPGRVSSLFSRGGKRGIAACLFVIASKDQNQHTHPCALGVSNQTTVFTAWGVSLSCRVIHRRHPSARGPRSAAVTPNEPCTSSARMRACMRLFTTASHYRFDPGSGGSSNNELEAVGSRTDSSRSC